MGKLSSALISSFDTGNLPYFTKVKEVDESITEDIVISADSELKFNARANKIYHVRIFIHTIAQSATPDLDDALIIPALATAIRKDADWNSGTVGSTVDWETENLNQVSTNELVMELVGVVRMGSTAGEVAFGWAQNVSSVSFLKILAGSFIEVFES